MTSPTHRTGRRRKNGENSKIKQINTNRKYETIEGKNNNNK